ncbi:MAG: hypothetical protein IJ229_04155 [Clostridia bacterium]|nr:hypothetical protein [Clostridia bacterium]
MRRFAALLTALVLTLLMTFGAQAVSYSDRGRYYLYVTTADTQMYTMSQETADDGTITTTYTPSGSLPAGTPVSAGEVLDDTYQKIVYMDQSSSTHTVIIRKDVIKGNYVTLDFGGTVGKVRIPRPASANSSFIRDYLNYRGISVTDNQIASALGILSDEATTAPASADDISEQNDTFPDASPSPDSDADKDTDEDPKATATSKSSGKTTTKTSTNTKKSSAAATPAPTERPSVTADSVVFLQDDSGNLVLVTIKELGLARSTIIYNGQEYVVETSRLTWNTNATEKERLAIVYAPKTGKASLRKTAKTSSAVLQKMNAGTIVRVFDVGSNMTGIYTGDTAGYMLNSTLTFVGTESSYTTGKLSYQGSLTNTHRINFYTQAKEASRKIGGVHAGDSVVIFQETGTWTEVDLDGAHGWILSKFVTKDEATEPLSVLGDLTASSVSKTSAAADDSVIEEEEEEAEPEATARSGYNMLRDPYK